MRKRLFTLAAAALLLLATSGAHAYVETFDSGYAGWLATTVNNNGGITYPTAGYQAIGGNLGGHVTGTVNGSLDRLYGIQAPSEPGTIFGNLTGQTMTVDYRIDGQVTGPAGAMARFYIGYFNGQSRYWVSNDAFSWKPNLDTVWTTHQVSLLASNFTEWPNQNNGDMTFDQVLNSYNDIGLVFSDGFTENATLGFSGSGTIHVDNFGTVPIPAAAWLLGSGIVGLAALRRKLQK